MKLALYPTIQVSRPTHPNRFYAIPLIGFLIKIIMIVPIGIELVILRWAQFLVSILNACGIFTRGRYWKLAYELNIGIMRLEIKVSYFIFGLTDRYPGFSLGNNADVSITLPMPKNPSRVFATPLLGMVFRFVLLIPYLIYRHIVSFAATLSVLSGWIPVLFKGYYPETVYEIARDSVRVDQAVTAYFLGLSDTYPSFWISMNHKALKIVLLVLAALFTLWSFFGNGWNFGNQKQNHMQKDAYQAASQSVNSY